MDTNPNKASYNTSIAGWSFALARALDDYGIDAAKVFDDAGINLAGIGSAADRLPVSGVQQVWHYAAQNTDESFGIAVSHYLNPASFHALGSALWFSSSLLECLERLIRYRCVISHQFFCELLEEDGAYRLVLVDERSIKSEVTDETFIAYVVRLARQLTHPGWAPSLISSMRPELQIGAGMRDFFNTSIEANAPATSVNFSRDDLHRSLRYANPELVAQQDKLVERYIAQLGLISEYMLRVRTEIHHLLSSGPVTIEQVADRLNVTVRTLQRRLSAEHSSYNQLLDEIRRQLALDYAKDPSVSATELAFKLGFSDSGSFGRSFKRWTNQSFTSYRDSR